MESLIYLIVSLLVFIGCVYIARFIFDFKTLIRHSKAQTNLLAAIAEKHGIDRMFIVDIMSKAEDKSDLRKSPMSLPSETE